MTAAAGWRQIAGVERIAIVALLKPFVLLVFLFLLAAGVIAVRKWVPDGRLKRLLLKRIL